MSIAHVSGSYFDKKQNIWSVSLSESEYVEAKLTLKTIRLSLSLSGQNTVPKHGKEKGQDCYFFVAICFGLQLVVDWIWCDK